MCPVAQLPRKIHPTMRRAFEIQQKNQPA